MNMDDEMNISDDPNVYQDYAHEDGHITRTLNTLRQYLTGYTLVSIHYECFIFIHDETQQFVRVDVSVAQARGAGK